MILGVGLDIAASERFQAWLADDRLLARYFTPTEIRDSISGGVTAHYSLAARFAAKEAFGKALGTGLAGLVLKDIEVVRDRNGKPGLSLHGSAVAAARKRGVGTVFLSLSHDSGIAAAVVVLEREETEDVVG